MNGNGQAAPQMQITPVEAAQCALMFLSRADMKAHERQQFGIAEALLQAIASGRVVIGPAPEVQPTLADAAAPAVQ